MSSPIRTRWRETHEQYLKKVLFYIHLEYQLKSNKPHINICKHTHPIAACLYTRNEAGSRLMLLLCCISLCVRVGVNYDCVSQPRLFACARLPMRYVRVFTWCECVGWLGKSWKWLLLYVCKTISLIIWVNSVIRSGEQMIFSAFSTHAARGKETRNN